MATSILDDVAIPTFTNDLKTLDHILSKAEEYAKSKGLDVSATFAGARLIEDQKPLTFQVQNATKTINTTLIRLTGIDYKPFDETEKTFEDLHKRIQVTLELLKAVKPGAYAKKEDERVELPFGGKILKVSGKIAALNQGIPNFFFHLNTAFSILRAKGVPIGKADYISSFIGL